MKLSYAIHAPWPYWSPSAGSRALYILADRLQRLGAPVAIAPIHHERPPREPPFRVELVTSWTAGQQAEAVHVYPDIVEGNPARARRVVRWYLGPEQYPPGPDDLEFAWVPEFSTRPAPRLMVDVIEPDLFFAKSRPGTGTALWIGKGLRSSTPRVERLEVKWSRWRLRRLLPPTREITSAWPHDRAELADLLRDVDLLISYDCISSLNLEAVLCGTPVLLAGPAGRRLRDTIIGHLGMVCRRRDLDRARSEIPAAIERYQAVGQEIFPDIERFVAVCEDRFV